MNSNAKICTISPEEVFTYFSETHGKPNDLVRDNYCPLITESERMELDSVSVEMIHKHEIDVALNSIAVDTSPGPDHVIVRVIKDNIAAEIIAAIGSRMLQTGVIPINIKKKQNCFYIWLLNQNMYCVIFP